MQESTVLTINWTGQKMFGLSVSTLRHTAEIFYLTCKHIKDDVSCIIDQISVLKR